MTDSNPIHDLNGAMRDLLARAQSAGLSQDAIAKSIGIHRVNLNQTVKGNRKIGIVPILALARLVRAPLEEREDLTVLFFREILRTTFAGAFIPLIGVLDTLPTKRTRKDWIAAALCYAKTQGVTEI